MRPIADVRHANLLLLLSRFDTLQAFADKVGRSSSQISQLKNRSRHSISGEPRNIDSALARDFEATLKLTNGWMDVDHDADPWPFPDVDRARWDRLTDDDKAFVQRMLNAALTECEERARPRTLHEEQKRYRADK